MIIRLFGAGLIIFGCGAFGFKLASDYIKRINGLKQLISVLDHISNELQYRLTPLPDLCRQASGRCKGPLGEWFTTLEKELESQISPDVERCVSAALYKHKELPNEVTSMLELLGLSLGKFDLEGQISSLQSVKRESVALLDKLNAEKDLRVRNYKTLALCAGVALTILFI